MSLLSRLFGKPDVVTSSYFSDSLECLATRWVHWAASTKVDCSPISDNNGAFAADKQPEDIWFLAGCFGGRVRRECTIPANKRLFIPVFNIWMTESYRPLDLSKAFGGLSVDGQMIELDRIYTKDFFVVKGVWGNPVTGSIFGKAMRVDGLWKLLDPLPVGEHEVFFRGGDGQGFCLDVTYAITVTP